MAPAPIQTTVHHSEKSRQFTAYNVLMIVAMGFGSMGFGYTAAIIATTLGRQKSITLGGRTTLTLSVSAQPTFLTYFNLIDGAHATALISTMNVRSSAFVLAMNYLLTRNFAV